MKLLFLGDVVGRSGRAAVIERLPGLRTAWGLDFVVVNGENASQGAGITGDHAKELLAAGADCLTLGDHAFDQKDMLSFIEQEPRIVRPLNFSKVAPGRGARVFEATQGRKVLVTQALGPNVIGDIAAKLGVGQGDAAGGIAQVLPELIDKLTPHGQAPQGGLGSEGDIMGALTRMLGR